jgi:glucans biosynthesis protein
VGTDLWRVLFDVEPQKEGPVDLRAFLRGGGKTLSETWLYQLF